MSEQLQGVLIGAGIAAVVALIGLIAEGRRDRRRIAHESELASQQRSHEKAEKRYDDLRSVYTAFAAEMRKQVATAYRFEERNQYGFVDDPQYDPSENTGYRDEAEDALQALALFADDSLYQAARGYLDSYYVRFWAYTELGTASRDVRRAEAAFVAEGKRALDLEA